MHNYQVPALIPQSIFRAYDIRGVAGEVLTADVVYAIALAMGSYAQEKGQNHLIIARDGRLSGPELFAALQQGLLDSGCDVTDIGEVPSPILYFATHTLKSNSGVILTASHNPAEYNGLKIVINNKSLTEQELQNLYSRIIKKDFKQGKGLATTFNVEQDYLRYINDNIVLARPLKIVIDCGNGIAGRFAPTLFKTLGCEVIELFCDVNGSFPNHEADPSQLKNLRALQKTVLEEEADIGLAFDGDGDRLGVVTDQGDVIWPDRQLMLYASDILACNPGAEIIFDVKCSKHLAEVIEQQGGHATMWRTGHSLIKAKLQATKAPLAGEMSGHIFFNDRWFGFDDGIYTGARLLEILAADSHSAHEVFQLLPNSINTPELKIEIAEERKFAFVEELKQKSQFPEAKLITIDGLRVEFEYGWGLIRTSNTSPCLTTRFEADDEVKLKKIQDIFRQQLLAIEPNLKLPF